MKIKEDVLAVLSAAEVNGCEIRLVGQLDRKMYLDVNKVIEAAGGKWNRKAKAHVFESDAEERIDQIILSGEVELPKDEFNYFPTPKVVVDRLIELAVVKHGMWILEPSAGRGAIAFECARLGAVVDCIELKKDNYDFLLQNESLNYVHNDDFLNINAPMKYDLVIMNPPFAKRADIKHVMHAIKSLKKGGKLVSVMSAGVKFRSDKLTTEFRDMIDAIEDLPEGAFKESGTMVNTVIVTINN